MRVDAFAQSTGVYALAVAIAQCLSQEELVRLALLLTQLGTTLSTLAALQSLESSTAAGETRAAELSAL